MGDPNSKSPTPNFYGVLGLSRTASLGDVCKAYKSLVMKWHPDRNPSNKAEAEARFSSINEAYRALSSKKREEANACNGDHHHHQQQKTPKKKSSSDARNGDDQEFHISSPKLLSRTTSRISPTNTSLSPTDFYASFSKTSSPGGSTPTTPGTPKEHGFLSKTASRSRSTTPIFFSQSAVRRKPPPIERKLECTLEELCVGCVKKIKITRDVISNTGFMVEEEEILMIKVKRGWRKGTKITFEGKGGERPGTLPADIIFIIDEKRHPIFKREGDDLELGVEVPLVQALTGCTISIPVLGGMQISVSMDNEIIYPGYEKIVPGQGMAKSKEEGMRGDLRLKFLVEFPEELGYEQRLEVVRILQECPDSP